MLVCAEMHNQQGEELWIMFLEAADVKIWVLKKTEVEKDWEIVTLSILFFVMCEPNSLNSNKLC